MNSQGAPNSFAKKGATGRLDRKTTRCSFFVQEGCLHGVSSFSFYFILFHSISFYSILFLSFLSFLREVWEVRRNAHDEDALKPGVFQPLQRRGFEAAELLTNRLLCACQRRPEPRQETPRIR